MMGVAWLRNVAWLVEKRSDEVKCDIFNCECGRGV